MGVRISGYPTGERTATGASVAIYSLPHNSDIRIKFYKERSMHNFEVRFHFSLYRLQDGGESFAHNFITVPEQADGWHENLYDASLYRTKIVMKLREDLINELYDLFRRHMCIGTDDFMKVFFFKSAYNSLFNDIDHPPYRPPMVQEKKPEPIDTTPPEIKSALHIHDKGIKLQKKIYQDTVEFQKEVSEHYKKYGTLGQRFIEYLKSFIPKI